MSCETGEISDGYHTFNELYDHRIVLYIAICVNMIEKVKVLKNHYDGWDCVYLDLPQGAGVERQVSYHIPSDLVADFMPDAEIINENIWDGHTPDDVVNRIKCYLMSMALSRAGR